MQPFVIYLHNYYIFLAVFFTYSGKDYIFACWKQEVSSCNQFGCPDGGMVDTQDLKSCDHYGCAGSSPAPGTIKSC